MTYEMDEVNDITKLVMDELREATINSISWRQLTVDITRSRTTRKDITFITQVHNSLL